jgi:hypothetical protein
VLLGSVLKHVASAKLELEFADAKIQPARNRDATNLEVFENDLMVDLADLLLLGQLWHVAKTICVSQRKTRTGTILQQGLTGKSWLLIRRPPFGEDSRQFLQKLIGMQLGSILIIADVLANGV